MTVIESWYDAGKVAHALAGTTTNPWKKPGTTRLTAVFRAGNEGLAGTEDDDIWDYPTSINRDYIDITWGYREVYVPPYDPVLDPP